MVFDPRVGGRLCCGHWVDDLACGFVCAGEGVLRVAERSSPGKHLVCGLPLPWLAVRALPLWLLADQCRPACFQVMLDSLDRALTNHDDPLLVAFANDRNKFGLERKLVRSE